MPKRYIAFHENGVVREINTEGGEDFLLLPGRNPSALALRYALVDGEVVDQFAGQPDEAVLAELKARQDEQTASAATVQLHQPLTKLAFMNRFTMEELAGIYTAAKSEVMVEVFLDKLKLAEDVDISDANTQLGIQRLVASGLLGAERAAEILQ